MKDEHCVMWGFDWKLTSRNCGLITTPQTEYNISTGRESCPDEHMLDKKGRCVRIIKRIEELRQLQLCRKAGLTDDEILAVVRALQTLCGESSIIFSL
jgi:hypothetical protein